MTYNTLDTAAIRRTMAQTIKLVGEMQLKLKLLKDDKAPASIIAHQKANIDQMLVALKAMSTALTTHATRKFA